MTFSVRLVTLLALTLSAPLSGCDGPAAPPDVPVTPDAPAIDAPAITDVGLDAPPDDDTGTSDAPITADAPPGRDLAILLVGDLEPTGFGASSFRSWLDAQGTITELADPALSAATLDAVDLLVVAFLPRALVTSERTALTTWLSVRGGRAIVLGGYEMEGRDELQSVTASLGILIDLERTTFPSDPTEFVAGAVSQGDLTEAPPFAGTFTIDSLGAVAVAEIRTSAGDDVAARWESSTGGGAGLFVADDHPTLDLNWDADLAAFWENVLSFLFDRAT